MKLSWRKLILILFLAYNLDWGVDAPLGLLWSPQKAIAQEIMPAGK